MLDLKQLKGFRKKKLVHDIVKFKEMRITEFLDKLDQFPQCSGFTL